MKVDEIILESMCGTELLHLGGFWINSLKLYAEMQVSVFSVGRIHAFHQILK